MAEYSKKMDRRKFLFRSASLLVGGLLGLNHFSRAFASGENNNKSLFRPRVAIIIDDIGFSLSHARQFLGLGIPITFSILPRLANSHNLAIELCGEGHEIMLHQPMEPYDPQIDPGPGALYVGDEAERIINIMEENISNLPFAIGVNNHMGSKFTARQKEMNEVLPVIKRRSLFFIDSLTTGRSKGYKTAQKLPMHTAFRTLFTA